MFVELVAGLPTWRELMRGCVQTAVYVCVSAVFQSEFIQLKA